MTESNIAQFYAGRSLFITGATGFMGKVLIEKLLRSCPGIDRLYLLMRPSKGKDVACRLKELINNQVTSIFKIDFGKYIICSPLLQIGFRRIEI